MRLKLSLVLTLAAGAVWAADAPKEPTVVAKPDAFKTLYSPDCSHCKAEDLRRKDDLRADDRVLFWRQVTNDGYTNDGAIPIRFFLNPYRVLSDSWGVFVYDPDAGYARGFRPEGKYSFHGWRSGVMAMKGADGTLYSCLTGVAFDGPKKGTRLEPRATLVTNWGFAQKRYPQAVAFTMFEKYRPVEMPTEVNEDSRKSRVPADGRLPADTMVLGVWDGKQARAYPLDALEKAGVIHEPGRVVLWYGPTKTAAAYRLPTFGEWTFSVDPKPKDEAAPFVDKRTGGHWDITGRGVGGGPMLPWLDGVQVKWFAWAAEYPETSVYGKDLAKPDYKPLAGKNANTAGPLGNLDLTARRFAILKAVDPRRQRVTLLIDGETEAKEWPLRADAEVRHAGWWGRLDQFTLGDRVWVWFDADHAKQPVAISLFTDELSEQDLYGPVKVKAVDAPSTGRGTLTLETVRDGKPAVRTVKLPNAELYRGDAKAAHDSLKVGETVHVQTTGADARLVLDPAAFEKRRAAQKAALHKRWVDEGLPGTLVFAHPQSCEVELMLDHEAMRWGRSLKAGDKVTLHAATPIQAVVRQLRPWRERTQVLLRVEGPDAAALTTGERVPLRMASPPGADDEKLPPGLGKAQGKAERVEWLMSGVYCTCGMHDGCAGHCYTLAACIPGGTTPCGLAKRTRADIADLIDKGQTDQQIFEELLKGRGPKLLRPHLSP
jgi:Protein of unknown function (DUF3179)